MTELREWFAAKKPWPTLLGLRVRDMRGRVVLEHPNARATIAAGVETAVPPGDYIVEITTPGGRRGVLALDALRITVTG